MASKEPTLTEISQRVDLVLSKIELLITAAKEGGGLVPHVDYVVMQEMREKVGINVKLKCKKQCKIGPCRYGPPQALECFELLEAAMKKRKKRKFLAKHMPYYKKTLFVMKRSELMMLAGILGVNMRKVLKKKGSGNQPIIDAILIKQPKYVEKRAKKEKKKLKEKLSNKPSVISEEPQGNEAKETPPGA